MSVIFNQIQNQKVGRNTFDLSYQRKMSLDMGKLVPIHVMDCVPGDTIEMSTSQMLRFAPMIAPVMHNIKVYTHFFFVPNRLIWPNWEDFITGGEDGTATPAHPIMRLVGTPDGSLRDYMGLPTIADNPSYIYEVSALPFAAYQKIYNEYYRDQNLVPKVVDELIDGDNNINFGQLLSMRRRAWQHDYFTSALPWTQKGAEATIPLGTTAPIDFDGDGGLGTFIKDAAGNINANMIAGTVRTDAAGQLQFEENGPVTSYNIDNSDLLSVDLSSATAATIIDLRNAFKLQEWLEKNARGGSRYTEVILSHFGVRSSDARLQRPEFLGGGSSPVVISEVLQTTSTDTTSPQGNMAGHGLVVGANNSFRYKCEEHGYIIGIMTIMPRTAYQQGIPRHYLRRDKFDYFWPEFQHIGEQPIENREIYVADDGEDGNTFGYIPRYAEYKYMPDTVHGEFRSSLDFWHMGRKFSNRPNLNQTFIECDPTTRIFAVEEGAETMYAQIVHRIKASRKMAYFGSPRM